MKAVDYIKFLQLQQHPEGGFYKETYRSVEQISSAGLPERFQGTRHFSTAIYYLLEQGDFSAFHKINSDECWHFYEGGPLLIHSITTDGIYNITKLGRNIMEEETLQYVVAAGVWFAAEPDVNTEFSLVGCTVAPGFDFSDFEMGDKQNLLGSFPLNKNVIKRLCR